MQSDTAPKEIDYLVIGHLTSDISPHSSTLGGTAAYSSLTARAIGLRVGIITSFKGEVPENLFEGIQIQNIPALNSTTFENTYSPEGRKQVIHHTASQIDAGLIPEIWKSTPIVHLGPVVDEFHPSIGECFPNSFIGVTAQGWLRYWDDNGLVSPTPFKHDYKFLKKVNCMIISDQDVQHDNFQIKRFADVCDPLIVTKGGHGAVAYTKGKVLNFKPKLIEETDPTGAGDIFATIFFIHYNQTKDVEFSAIKANTIAGLSVKAATLTAIKDSIMNSH